MAILLNDYPENPVCLFQAKREELEAFQEGHPVKLELKNGAVATIYIAALEHAQAMSNQDGSEHVVKAAVKQGVFIPVQSDAKAYIFQMDLQGNPYQDSYTLPSETKAAPNQVIEAYFDWYEQKFTDHPYKVPAQVRFPEGSV